MKLSKGEVVTFRFRISDPEKASAIIAPLFGTMYDRQPCEGVVVTAVCRGDVFAERDKLERKLEFIERNDSEKHIHEPTGNLTDGSCSQAVKVAEDYEEEVARLTVSNRELDEMVTELRDELRIEKACQRRR